jgi:hypothetical protein
MSDPTINLPVTSGQLHQIHMGLLSRVKELEETIEFAQSEPSLQHLLGVFRVDLEEARQILDIVRRA